MTAGTLLVAGLGGFVGSQLLATLSGLADGKLEVGDVDVTRESLDVADLVEAYFVLLEHGQNGAVYNVCSGVERRVRDWILLMADLPGGESSWYKTQHARAAPGGTLCGKLHEACG